MFHFPPTRPGSNGPGESDALPCHPEAEEPSAPIPERVVPVAGQRLGESIGATRKVDGIH